MYPQLVELSERMTQRFSKFWIWSTYRGMISASFFYFFTFYKFYVFSLNKNHKNKNRMQKRSSNRHDGLFLDICPYANVGRIRLQHLSTYLKTFDVPFGFEIIVCQTVPYWRRLSWGQLECLLIKVRGISVGLLLLSNQTHVLLGFTTGFVFFKEHSQHVLGIIEFLDLDVGFST